MCVIFALILTAIMAGQPEESSSQPATQPASQPTSQPAELEWLLSPSHYPSEIGDEAAYRRWAREQRAELLAKAKRAGDPILAAQFRLAAANHILAREVEPFISRWLLDISKPDDVDGIRTGLAEAREQLKLAAEALAGEPAGDAGHDAPARSTLETLEALAGALEAISAEDSDATASARQAAATALAVLLEDDRKDVAAAALLWQAVLYRQTGQTERAFQLLPTATERLSRDGRRHQFHTRLLRCRMLADRGSYAAAGSLLLRIEENTADWFTEEAEQDAAANTAILMRLQVVEKWRSLLDPAAESSEIAWCDRTSARLRAALAEQRNPVPLLGLDLAIPILAKPPEAVESP